MYLLKFGNKLNIAKILTTLPKKNDMVENGIKVNMPEDRPLQKNKNKNKNSGPASATCSINKMMLCGKHHCSH